MKNIDRFIAVWACFLVTCAIVFVCAGLSGVIFENSSNIASWVQAVGSVGAICGGVWAVQHQIKEQRMDAKKISQEFERSRMTRSAQLLLGTTVNAFAMFGYVVKFSNIDMTPWGRIADHLDALVKLFDKFSGDDLPSPAEGMYIVGLTAPITALSIQCRWNEKNNINAPQEKAELKKVVAAISRTLSDGIVWLNNELERNATPEELDSLKRAKNYFIKNQKEG